MSDEDALVRAIAADPKDELPKLVYADWLEESGRPENVARAEFIRLQIGEGWFLDEGMIRFPILASGRRDSILLNRWKRHWLKPIADLIGWSLPDNKYAWEFGEYNHVKLSWGYGFVTGFGGDTAFCYRHLPTVIQITPLLGCGDRESDPLKASENDNVWERVDEPFSNILEHQLPRAVFAELPPPTIGNFLPGHYPTYLMALQARNRAWINWARKAAGFAPFTDT